jgi:hypothetical protein
MTALRRHTAAIAAGGARHQVRCLLFEGAAPGGHAGVRHPGGATVAASPAAPAPCDRQARPCCRCRTCRCASPSAAGCCSAREAGSTPSRRVVRRGPRRDAGAGGRVGLWQDHHRQGHRAAAAHGGPDRRPACWTAKQPVRAAGPELREPRAGGADHLPGPVCVAEPAHAGAEMLDEGLAALQPDLDIGARAASASKPWSTRWACAAMRWTASRTSSRAASASASPSPARWRSARADRLRRADLGAGRVGAGADPEPAARAAARAGRVLPVHHPQHRRGRVHRRPRGGDAGRAHRGAGRLRRDYTRAGPACSRSDYTRARRGCWPRCRRSARVCTLT